MDCVVTLSPPNRSSGAKVLWGGGRQGTSDYSVPLMAYVPSLPSVPRSPNGEVKIVEGLRTSDTGFKSMYAREPTKDRSPGEEGDTGDFMSLSVTFSSHRNVGPDLMPLRVLPHVRSCSVSSLQVVQ